MGGKRLVNGLECRLRDSQVIPNLARRFRNFFLGPILELFSTRNLPHFQDIGNNVDPADPAKFEAFPGNSTNNVDKNPDLAFLAKPGMPSLGFCRHYFLKFLEMQKIMLGQRGRPYF